MKVIDVTITGTQELLLHKYTVSTVADPKSRVVKTKDSSNYDDEWKKATYLNKDGKVIMPGINLMACIFDGSKGMRKGKTYLTRTIYTSLQVSPNEPLILVSADEKSVDESQIVKRETEGGKFVTLGKYITLKDIENNNWLNQSGVNIRGNKVDRIRTMLPMGWTINFQIVTLDDSLSIEDVQMILENAGKRAGLGDWRPSAPKKPGPYGTFDVSIG